MQFSTEFFNEDISLITGPIKQYSKGNEMVGSFIKYMDSNKKEFQRN
jgi:hypothetical protein